MGTENKVILELLKSHSDLTSDNPTLELGQRVFVTGITDALGNGEKIGDNATAYTSLKWQRYETLKTIDLTGDDVTYTLPKILGGYQRVSIYWTDGGTYKMTLAVTDSETVGGLSAGTWEGEGEGHMVVESDGTNWQVREYEDSGDITNTAIIFDRTFRKYLNGDILVKGWYEDTLDLNVSNNGLFSSIAQQIDYGYTLNSSTENILATTMRDVSNIVNINAGAAAPTTTYFKITFTRGDSATSVTAGLRWQATGRWRT